MVDFDLLSREVKLPLWDSLDSPPILLAGRDIFFCEEAGDGFEEVVGTVLVAGLVGYTLEVLRVEVVDLD